MNTNTIITVGLAALLVLAGGAAAMPGQAPDDPGDDGHGPDDSEHADENASVADGNVTDSDEERDENATAAPPSDMPENVPEHVTEIHVVIREKLNGTLGNQTLGAAISGLVGGGQSHADGEAPVETEDASDRGGPSGDLPEQAADHVRAIHDAITSFLNTDGDARLGAQISASAGSS